MGMRLYSLPSRDGGETKIWYHLDFVMGMGHWRTYEGTGGATAHPTIFLFIYFSIYLKNNFYKLLFYLY